MCIFFISLPCPLILCPSPKVERPQPAADFTGALTGKGAGYGVWGWGVGGGDGGTVREKSQERQLMTA